MNPARQKRIDTRGRVTLRMRGGVASPLILEVAARVVRTFRGELRGLFIENEELLALAQMPFAREILLSGGRSRSLSLDVVRREMQAASSAMEREFERLTRAAKIPAHFEVVRGAAEEAFRETMRQTGILAIGEPLALAAPGTLSAILDELGDLPGLVVAGWEARRAKGRVLTVIDPGCDVAMMVDTAEKIAGESAEELVLLILSAEQGEAQQLDTEIRKALDPGTRYTIDRITSITPKSLSALADRYGAGLVIARIGSPIALEPGDTPRYACALACPLLLLR